MKNLHKTILLSLLLVLGATGVSGQGQPVKVGYTNIEVVLSYMPEALAVEKELQTFVQQQEKYLEVKYKYFQSEMEVYMTKEQNHTWRSEEEKKAFEVKLQNLEREIKETEANADQELMDRRIKGLEPIQKKIQEAIDAVAKEGAFTYILNQTAGGGIPSILYGLDQYDVTDLIAAKLGITIPKAENK